MTKAVVFDLDGTLADSLDSIWYSANAALAKFGFAPCGREQYRYFVGDGAAALMERCLRYAGDTELQFFDRVFAEYKCIFKENCMYHLEPYIGIREMLAALKRKHIKIAVLSNKPHEQTIAVVETVFGKGYFDYIQGQTDSIEKKPSPEGVQLILKAFHMEAEEILYVGDTGTDMQTGKASGALTVGVLWGFRERGELESNYADIIIEKPRDLLDYIV